MEMNKKRLLAPVLLLVVVLIWISLTNFDEKEQVEAKIPLEQVTTTQTKPQLTAITKPDNPAVPNSYTQCQTYDKQYYKSLRQWQEQMTYSAAQFLEQGYSLDDVTYVIKHFRNGNFAVDWRHKHLLADSKAAEYEQELLIKVNAAIASGLPFHISLSYPRESLKNFAELNTVERQKAIEQDPPTVDDVYAFLKSGELNENEIISLIAAIEEPQELLYNAGPQIAMHLLDALLKNRMLEAASYLLDNGYQPKDDSYFNNSLEIAFNVLYGELKSKASIEREQVIAKLMSLIKRITAQGLTAKMRVLNNGSIRFNNIYSGPFFEFSLEEQSWLQEHFDYNLLSVANLDKEVFSESTQEIIDVVESQQHGYLNELFKDFNYRNAKQHCTNLIKQADEAWRAPWGIPQAYLDELNEKHAGETNSIEAEIAILDPDYVDCFRDIQFNRKRYKDQNTSLGKAYYDETPETKEALIAFIQKHNPTEREKTWITYQFLQLNFLDNKIPIELGLIPDHTDFMSMDWNRFQLADLKYLNSIGIDTRGADYHGKTALYFAIKANRQDLIKHMLKDEYMFTANDGSQDPLHLLLASWKSNFSPARVKETLPTLMQFTPTIDRFHLARMKLLTLRDKALYDFIVEQYPQLIPEETTEYPQAACR